MAANLILKNVCKTYENKEKAVVNFNMEIEKGEFIVVIGPSGCGKSSLLRMIAGIEEITSGELIIDGVLSNDIEPRYRDIAMVFQDYALYANMTIYENLAFSLILRKRSKEEIKEKVEDLAKRLGLEDILDSYPPQISGGQKQRVAVGRAIIRNPVAFLLDEPLSNVDNKLRTMLRKELSMIHAKLDMTFIYVTHEQSEAMTLATKIVVMNKGVIQQIGTPSEIYYTPANVFVAKFMGTPAMNCVFGEVDSDGYFKNEFMTYKIEESKFEKLKDLDYIGKKLYLGVRPENISVKEDDSSINLEFDYMEALGPYNLIHTKENILIKTSANFMWNKEEISLSFDKEKVLFYSEDENIINL